MLATPTVSSFGPMAMAHASDSPESVSGLKTYTATSRNGRPSASVISTTYGSEASDLMSVGVRPARQYVAETQSCTTG